MSSKLIIHETDYRGHGYMAYNGKAMRYACNEIGDARRVVEQLIELGFISKDKVIIYEGKELYKILTRKEG